MKVAAYYGPGLFKVEERPLPEIGDGEMLVKVIAVGICGTDVHKAVHQTVKAGTVLGHEVAGIVERVGKDVTKFKVRDRVALAHHAPCMTCHQCLKNHHSLCDQYLKNNIFPGGFSQYVKVLPEHVRGTIYPITNDSTTFEEAAFMEPLACCVRGFHALDFQEGDTVLIIGAGPIGLQHLMLACAFNAGKVVITDLNPDRLRVAKTLGADLALNPQAKDFQAILQSVGLADGFDHVIVTVGVGALYEQGVSLAGKGGNVLVFAETPKGQKMTIEPNSIYSKELRIVGSYSSSPKHLQEALELIESGRIPVKTLISDRVPLEQVGEGIERSHKATDCLKIMVIPNQ
ncbi:MAG: L-iditol 2-dehydrogenase [Promethearchaeota archaeon CR_4]|nr:MAG: L-iditol 2-dehydrogenase [Candidatus Lokiarchaeota archaeon CR_4]